MHIAAVGASGSVGEGTAVYAKAAVPANHGAATATSGAAATPPPVVPFANPAISQIAQLAALNAALAGTGGLLVQSYGAVALIVPPALPASSYAQPAAPVIPPVAPVARIADRATQLLK